jgi:hypothetical protein
MTLVIGNKPCKYSDCFHYMEDCDNSYYDSHSFCSRCKNYYGNIPYKKPWWKKLFRLPDKVYINRFEPIESNSRVKPDRRLDNTEL